MERVRKGAARRGRAWDPDPPRALARSLCVRGMFQRYQKLLDDATPHTLVRWVALGVVALVYALRVVFMITGFYIVTYALGIYLLNLLIAFLSPSIDPSLEMDTVRAPRARGACAPV